MTNVVGLEDIEEFRLAIRLPRTAITDEVVAGIRRLNEKTQIEPFLREILFDPTSTAHGSTEIADILTTHVVYGNRARHAAFVNKGKSTEKVTSKRVGYQILELRQLSGIDLMVLLAVGDIQDDIKRDLIQVATDAGADYMIVDAVDVARLFIAYQKVCPCDGTAFDEGRCPKCGTMADEPVELTIRVYEDFRYSLLEHKDVSHAGAKRYRADVLTDPHYTKAALREVVKLATWELRRGSYYRSDITEARFGDQEADCVFLFVYPDLNDTQHTNWICRAQWIRLNLPDEFRPGRWKGDEQIGEIVIDWNDNYEGRRNSFKYESKQQWVKRVEPLLPIMDRLVNKARQAYHARKRGETSDDEFRAVMSVFESHALKMSRDSSSGKLPPIECEEANRSFQGLVTMFHSIFVPFAAWSKPKRDWKFHDWHVSTYLGHYDEERESFQHEWRKVR